MQVHGIVFAFVSGIFTILSPCGFPMLPGYVSYYMGSKSMQRGVIVGLGCFLGVSVLYVILGIMAFIARSVLSPIIVFLEFIAGGTIVLMGTLMLIRAEVPLPLPRLVAPKRRGFVGAFLYGSLYSMATASCSLPILVSILFYSFISGGPIETAMLFIVYIFGMGVPLAITTIFAVIAKRSVMLRFVEMSAKIQRLSGIILIVVGLYIIYVFLATIGYAL